MILAVSTAVYTVGGVLYVAMLLLLGITAIRKGHWFMFLLGIVLPIFWIIGALMPPTNQALKAEAPPPPPQ